MPKHKLCKFTKVGKVLGQKVEIFKVESTRSSCPRHYDIKSLDNAPRCTGQHLPWHTITVQENIAIPSSIQFEMVYLSKYLDRSGVMRKYPSAGCQAKEANVLGPHSGCLKCLSIIRSDPQNGSKAWAPAPRKEHRPLPSCQESRRDCPS